MLLAVERLGALVDGTHGGASRPSWPSCTSAAAASPKRPARSRRGSTACASSGRSDERALEEVREHARRAEIDEAEITLRLETAVEAVRRDLDAEPERAIAAECPPLAEGVTPQARVRELERELRLMGPINPLALAGVRSAAASATSSSRRSSTT